MVVDTAGPESYELLQLEVSGTARSMGREQGEALRERIHAFVAQRFEAVSGYLTERGGPDVAAVRSMAALCLERAADWDPEGTAEHHGIAEGARLDAVDLYAATNMTDVRDAALFAADGAGGRSSAEEACTSVLVPGTCTEDGTLLVGQTWDLNPPDLEFVVAIHRRTAEGPDTWSVTCTGCLTLVGMNDLGVTVGTTNVKTRVCQPGVGYLSLLHRAVRQPTAAAAAAVIAGAPRAAAHTYWLADAHGGVELECDAERVVRRELDGAPIVRTNHCIAPEFVAEEAEPPPFSSHTRFERATDYLSAGHIDVARLRALFADRSDGLKSINRYPEDDQGTATNAVVVASPSRREVWACRGPADRGAWVRLAH